MTAAEFRRKSREWFHLNEYREMVRRFFLAPDHVILRGASGGR